MIPANGVGGSLPPILALSQGTGLVGRGERTLKDKSLDPTIHHKKKKQKLLQESPSYSIQLRNQQNVSNHCFRHWTQAVQDDD